VIKILLMMNEKDSDSQLLFAKFLFFIITQTGYEISFHMCSSCGEKIESSSSAAFSYSEGIICENCNINKELTFNFNEELFNLFKCLTTRKNIGSYKKNNLESIIFILEKFLEYHIPEFRGIKSLKMF
ncbi:MAG: DNA repair protein RecO C-terminal domain-containing protein, partial [Melioribacteraceae bacterium]